MLVHKHRTFLLAPPASSKKNLRQVIKSYTAVIVHDKIWHIFALKVVGFMGVSHCHEVFPIWSETAEICVLLRFFQNLKVCNRLLLPSNCLFCN